MPVSNNQSLLYRNKYINNEEDRLEEINETAKSTNYLLLRVIIAGILLTTPMFLYTIALLPKAIPLSLLMIPALIGGPLAVFTSAAMLTINLLYFIPVKKILEIKNKKSGNKKNTIKQNTNQPDKPKNINNQKEQTPTRKPNQNNGLNNNNLNKRREIKRVKPTYVDKNKSEKVKQQKIVIKNGRPCYVNETEKPKIKRLKK